MTTAQGLMGSGYAPGAVKCILGEARTGLAATGTTLATALPLPSTVCAFESVPSGSGCRLPPFIQAHGKPSEGDAFMVANESQEPLNVYPGTVNGQVKQGGAGVPYVLAARSKARFFYAGSDRWAVILGASPAPDVQTLSE